MSELKALIFDVDGTLADTEREGHRPAFNQAFVEAGLDWHWSGELYGDLLTVTGGKERIRFFLNKYLPDFPLPENADQWIAHLHKRKTHFYTEMLANGAIPLRPGVERLIESAWSAGLRLAIATTTTPENVTALLENTLGKEGMSRFEVVAAGDIVPAKKPAPDIYVYAMERMELSANQCLAFEDSYNGLRSSQGAGLVTLVAVNDYTRDDDFTGAALVLDHWGEADQPFQVLAGDAMGAKLVDLELLRRLHKAHT